MGFVNRISGVLKQTASKDMNVELSASSMSLFQAIRSMSSWGDGDGDANWGGASSKLGWDEAPSPAWSTGLTKEHFDGEVVGRQVLTPQPSSPTHGEVVGRQGGPPQHSSTPREVDFVKELQEEHRRSRGFVDSSEHRLQETAFLLNQAREPGIRGSYLKDSEKAEMYKKHKENPEVYTVEQLAKEYRIMRQRVHAILWLKEDEEKEEKKLGKPLDDSVEMILDALPEYIKSHDREFHVASLPSKPDFKVMPLGWDGIKNDPDEVHYEISMKEDEQMYEEFVQRFNFNKMRIDNQVKVHRYSRRRPSEGWNFTVEKLGPFDKRGSGGGWKFVSQADGSSRPLNEYEKIFVKKETHRRRRKITP